ncbi:putative zinc protease [Fulvivirga imtechensis AK7]|uniref:Putative zinc protease n=1 Tax=Fulvivirga imtechensis AK7 TaxID=1237149 RepID=L8JZY6_9BACT|nr:aminopeptidase [Fulvivirga imtechensis]ELR72762.1 putative zinc protease [Fulvivirga imtechensis AK7]
MIKKISLGIIGILLLLIVWNFELVVYGIKQARGQLNIVWNARPVSAYLSDPAVADSVKIKLQYIQKVREYAIKELGLNDTDNYTSMYDQGGKPVLWVVTGCKPYKFEPREWNFPVVGKVPYKGFFVEKDAMQAMEKLKKDGYDAGVRTVGGWSTLGWFNDPILSSMLNRSIGDLANLIIHELVHATIFVKDSVEFNENLASFIGDEGARQFLQYEYGADSEEYHNYLKEVEDERSYVAHILRGADSLEVLYGSFAEELSDEDKEMKKQQLIGKIMQELDTVSLNNRNFFRNVKGYQPNNTFFMSFMRYRSKQNNLDDIYTNKFDQDIRAFITFLKKEHPFL